MKSRKLSILPVLSMTALLTSCAGSTPSVVERPTLPAAPSNFGKPVALPAAKQGESIKTFALKNRAAAVEANNRLINDASFYSSVLEAFSK
jgi:hypothetical protein